MTDFLPHAQCYLWRPDLIGLHLASDSLIGLSYIAISLTVVYVVRRRRDLPFNHVFVAFGLFILTCGFTHLMEVWTLWRPDYWVAGGVKLVTAVASVATAVLLPPLIPRAVALPSPAALERANRALATEVAERRAAEARTRALLESAPDAILLVDRAGHVELVNGRAEDLFGYPRAGLLGQPLALVLPDIATPHAAATTPVEMAGRHRDGEAIPIEVNGSPVAGGDGALVLVVRDARERHRVEHERADRLRAEMARAQAEEVGQRASFLAEASHVLAASLEFEATLKSMARVAIPYLADYVTVDVLDDDRHLRRVAGAHVDAGHEPALAEARPAVALAGDDAPVAAVLQRGEPTLVREVSEAWLAARPGVSTFLGVPGAGRPTSLLFLPLRARGRVLGLVTCALTGDRRYTLADLALAEDLAHRAALAADNARLYRDVQEASRAKDEFLAVLSHELRTPLTPVLGWIRMLRAGSLAPDAAARALDTIERNTRLQVQLVEDLLDVSRIITGKLHLEIHPVDMRQVVDSAVTSLAPAAAAKSIVVERRLGPTLPPIEGDANRLQQVVGNLLSNAVKFTPEGGRVDVQVVAVEGGVRLTVSDTGHGLPPELAPHVFERFRQADSTITRRHGGLGLGLAIVRHLVELHGGAVQASSPGVGQGSVFTVTLPVSGPSRLGLLSSESPARPGTPPRLAGVRALVVDDDADARELIGAILEAAGANVTTASAAEDALRILREGRFDVLVSDLAMPGRDGYELMHAVRSVLGQQLPAVAVSAQARPEDRRRAEAAGYAAHLTKPLEPERLTAIVRAVVDGQRITI